MKNSTLVSRDTQRFKKVGIEEREILEDNCGGNLARARKTSQATKYIGRRERKEKSMTFDGSAGNSHKSEQWKKKGW